MSDASSRETLLGSERLGFRPGRSGVVKERACGVPLDSVVRPAPAGLLAPGCVWCASWRVRSGGWRGRRDEPPCRVVPVLGGVSVRIGAGDDPPGVMHEVGQ